MKVIIGFLVFQARFVRVEISCSARLEGYTAPANLAQRGRATLPPCRLCGFVKD